MKKIFILTIIALLSLNSIAQDEKLIPKLTVFSEDGDQFFLIVDGVKINDQPQYRVENVELTTAMARVKIIFKNDKLPHVDKNVPTHDVDGNPMEMVFKIKEKKKGNYVLRNVSFTSLTTTTVYQESVNGEVTGTSSGITDDSFNNATTTTTTQGDLTGVNMNIDVNDNGETGTMVIEVNEMGGNMTTTTTTTSMTTTTTTSGTVGNNIIAPNPHANPQVATNDEPHSKPNPLPGYNGPIGCDNPMNQQSFNAAKQSVKSKTFDDSKLTVAKQIIKSNCMLVSQVKEIVNLLTFENDKLELAKFAYKFTYDKGNYYQINDVFTFSSSVEELDEYISSH